MDLKELCTPITIVCNCCHRELVGYKDETGAIKIRCKYCGAVTYSKLREKKNQLYIVVDLPNKDQIY